MADNGPVRLQHKQGCGLNGLKNKSLIG